MEPREVTPDEGERIAELVESSMTASYRLSPQEIEQITNEQFGADALEDKLADESTIVRVIETDEDVEGSVIAGYVEATLDEPWGEVNWLFVDPEHRGKGIGTTLYETTIDALESAGAEKRRATVLEANSEGGQFLEKFGLERAGERRIDLGDESLVEDEYAEPDAGRETSEEPTEKRDISGSELPHTDSEGDTTTATTDDGQQVVVDTDDRESGTDAPFFPTYTDDTDSDRYGYYCANCGSLDTVVDSSDRIECRNCGNSHVPRSEESSDDSYL